MTTFEFPTDPQAICQTLYNTESTCSKCIGYCTFHKGYITRKQLKTKQCLQKNCNALIKNTNHQFWIEREQKKEELKLKRIEEKRIEEEKLSQFHLITENQKKKNIHIRNKRFICLDLKTCKLTGKQKNIMKGGNPNEVIQIGAVMLDENLNYISQFSTFVKPVYGIISKDTVDNYEYYKDRLDHADTFSTAFYKLYTWAGSNQDDVTTLCWSNSVYTQLWDEIFIKAKNHDEYREFLKTFVDLQGMLGSALISKQQISFDTSLKYCHIKFDGLRDSALTYAINQARIFNKLIKHNKQNIDFNPLWKYTETNLSKVFYTANSHSNDFTSSFAAFMSKDLLQQFTQANESVETKTKTVAVNKTPAYISKLFSCTKYGINVNTWLKFSTHMLFIRDANYSKLAGTNN
ncbi:MAG: hypothetical protein J5710_07360 [Treponema sp.]|nr:hypothetical protein [Treponema sp.]